MRMTTEKDQNNGLEAQGKGEGVEIPYFQGRGVGMRREGSRRITSAADVGVHQHQNVDIMIESKTADT